MLRQRLRRSPTAHRALNAPLSPNTRLTFDQMATHPLPNVLPEEVFDPSIDPAISDPHTISVQTRVLQGDLMPPITLMKAENAELAYARIQKTSRDITHRHGNVYFTGELFFAVCYYQVGPVGSNVFQVPSHESAEYVAIKKINKRQLDRCLQEGGRENCYKEIERMRQLGDNLHVLSIVEALEDSTYIYIVTPMACQEGTLVDYVKSFAPHAVPVNRARQLFRKILDIICHLHSHGISHRDLSPDNLIFLTPDNLVAIDLAMSVRNPRDENGRRLLSPPQGTFGTPPFMPPEILNNRIFDGLAVDTWAAALNLYFMLTGRLLYKLPHPVDPDFLFFVQARGLSNVPLQQDTNKVLLEWPDFANRLRELVGHHRRLIGPSAMEVLQNILTMAACERCTFAQVVESDFVQGRI